MKVLMAVTIKRNVVFWGVLLYSSERVKQETWRSRWQNSACCYFLWPLSWLTLQSRTWRWYFSLMSGTSQIMQHYNIEDCTVMACIWEIFILNLGQGTRHPYWSFSWFISVPLDKCMFFLYPHSESDNSRAGNKKKL
jgi:hypothetical protein